MSPMSTSVLRATVPVLLMTVLCFLLVPSIQCNRPVGRTTVPSSSPLELGVPPDLHGAVADLAVRQDLSVPALVPPPAAPGSAAVCVSWELLFDLNSTVIQPSGDPLLRQVAACVVPGMQVSIVGHGDERGTPGKNLELGAQRASVVATALGALGLPRTQLKPQSAGASAPVCGEHEEHCWQRNRRVVISLVRPPQ